MGLFLLCLDSWQNYSRYMQQLLMYCTLWLTERFVTKHATSILESTQAAWNQQVDSIVLITTISKLPRSTFLQWWFCSLQSVRSDALNSSFAMFVYSWNRVTVKFWRQYLQNLQSYLEIFIIHLAAAVTLLQTDSTTSVCRHIFEIWPVLMAFTWKNRDVLVAFWKKISISHLGQTEHRSVRADGPRCVQHRDRISFIWCGAT